jgi:hypothetical protein
MSHPFEESLAATDGIPDCSSLQASKLPKQKSPPLARRAFPNVMGA